ncbi:AraC family transcriptional regulator [Nitrosomonas sp.]|uniref:AraC family transcriptional regulator n=1 Tax=Nitrosomonas sp. TaxID=42353 RepID=UPI001DCB3CB6|nr:AraC family transcriptional regulator [Nitrosomonas sp.]MCB1949768.1 AraC family transcriptional regulator [Nitrosomonas sp.]
MNASLFAYVALPFRMSAVIDLIDLVRLRVDIYHNARVCGDWRLVQHSDGEACFHLSTQGGFILDVPSYGNWLVDEGDLVIFPKELPHTMVPVDSFSGPQQHLSIPESQDIPGTSMLCGRVTFLHRGSQQLLNALPAVFVIRMTDNTPWLLRLNDMMLEESLASTKQANAILNRLTELLMSYALRHFVEQEPRSNGVLALYSHRHISRAIKAIHEQPAETWSLAALAGIANMSRTRFAETFKRVSGWSPMQYLAWWRMQLAWSLLHSGKHVANVADEVGYKSEAAFSRVFRKHFDISAGAVRRSSHGAKVD